MRRSDDLIGDSLELLLDTICNMFGTIIFVALIASLLAMTSTRLVVDSSLDAVESERRRALSSIRVRADELDRELAKLPAGDDAEVEEEAIDRTVQAIAEIERRQELIDQYTSAIERSRLSLDAVAEQAQPLREEIARLDSALESTRVAQQRTMRTPLERELGLHTYIIVLWHDQLYAVCDWSKRDPDPCERFRQWNASYVVPSKCSTPRFECDDELSIHRIVMLREGAGIPIKDALSLRTNPGFIEILRTLDPARDLIGFAVAPDSFDTFAIVKAEILSAGFNYNLDPCSDPLPIYRDSWMRGRARGL
ncbi:MAG: hypothetical protein EXS10_10705 [Phycisphaerales bacterium]|nr:hypothetical protein [Phycisphaerales bacterium]